ncbi:DUF3139 domain-containing protein [Brevibacillus marinus]|uniref:DUF3139 domain-containing protein n=1 Tax=Brevibacillus marinus TaxID=2496837 RepID=UPI000F843090|nr:DUF3139 domain-containing protein [Brevibacillus marinus]
MNFKRFLLISFIILLSFVLISNWERIIGGYDSKKIKMESDIKRHLAQRNVSEDDIYKIEVFYNVKLLGGDYQARVVFNDEKELYYIYYYLDGIITQGGYGVYTKNEKSRWAMENPKHLEED